jgi:hypothetical protein
MLEENNAGSGRSEIEAVNSGAAALVQHENQPKTARRHRVSVNGTDARAVRIGHVGGAEIHPQQSLPLLPTARSLPAVAGQADAANVIVPVAELAAIKEAIDDLKANRLDVAKNFADLNAKFDSMKESFSILEAHISVGLAKSIAEMMKKEVAALEQQIVERYRYRTRFALALAAVFALIAILAVDQAHPFIDRVANLFGN